MCGFVFSSDSSKGSRKKILEAMNLISHRGQDSMNLISINNNLFSHRRLSITGSGDIVQPFEDKNFVVMFNGELYDFKELKKKIKYKFTTDGDGELILGLLNNYDISDKDFWNNLNGEFSILIYDKIKNKLFLIRDRMGTKPLYYSIYNNVVVVASEKKAFSPFIKLELDEKVLNQKLSMQYHGNKDTIFENIYSVESGIYLSIDLNTNKISNNRYWELFTDSGLEKNFYSLIEESVKKRVLGKKVAVCLSGGIDSAIINYFVKKYAKEYKCFSISFTDNKDFNEVEDINIINNFFSNPCKIIEVNIKDMLSRLKESLYYSEDFSINLHTVAKYILFEEIKKDGFDISISGEGADELFLGYSHLMEDLSLKGNSLVKGMHTVNGEILFKEELGLMGINNHWIEAKLSQGNKNQDLLNFKLNSRFLSSIHQRKDLPLILESSFLWAKYSLNSYILSSLGDKLEMANTVEGRIPFLDISILNNISNLSIEERIGEKGEKLILKKIFKGKLPKKILDKKKHPFISSPIDFNNKYVRDFFISQLDIIENLGFVNKDIIEKMILNKNNNYATSILYFLSIGYIKEIFCESKK
jgi:asparagine synthase (glutamine-hydrolysing)